MSGKLTLEVLGRDYVLAGGGVEQLAGLLRETLEGRSACLRLEIDARPAKPVTRPTFRFLTKSGAERLNARSQKELLALCEQVIMGNNCHWPPRLAVQFAGCSSG